MKKFLASTAALMTVSLGAHAYTSTQILAALQQAGVRVSPQTESQIKALPGNLQYEVRTGNRGQKIIVLSSNPELPPTAESHEKHSLSSLIAATTATEAAVSGSESAISGGTGPTT